jgi:PAS domain S-box-containing protein
LASARNWLAIFDAMQDAICLLDRESRIVHCNQRMQEMTGLPRESLIGRPCWEIMHGTDGPIEECPVVRMRRSRQRETSELRLGDRWVEAVADPLPEPVEGPVEVVHLVHDITERKRCAAERERLIGELRHAMSHVKTLTGLLPICSKCKRIRDDHGYWQRLESYFMEHTQATFTHGLCPECLEHLYPGLFDPDPPAGGP